MRRRKGAFLCVFAVLAGSTTPIAHAERWIQVSPMDQIWYDADNVRETTSGLMGVWLAAGPNRINTRGDGRTTYPTYSVIDCKEGTAGPKIGLDGGTPLQRFEPNSVMGALITKLCIDRRQ